MKNTTRYGIYKFADGAGHWLRLLLLIAWVAFVSISAICFWVNGGHAEGADDIRFMTVIASQLNGRAYPTTKSNKEAFWDYGDTVIATGNWSSDHKWVEVKGGESGTVWCKAEYLTERTDTFTASNEGKRAVKIRKSPVDGKVVGYLKGGKETKISQVILGWGKCAKGWIDLDYLCEVAER